EITLLNVPPRSMITIRLKCKDYVRRCQGGEPLLSRRRWIQSLYPKIRQSPRSLVQRSPSGPAADRRSRRAQGAGPRRPIWLLVCPMSPSIYKGSDRLGDPARKGIKPMTGVGQPMAARFTGRSVPRKEDRRLVTGRGRYVDDVNRPGQLHAAFVRSEV